MLTERVDHCFEHTYQALQAAEDGLGVVFADNLEKSNQLNTASLVKLDTKALIDDQSTYIVWPDAGGPSLRSQVFAK